MASGVTGILTRLSRPAVALLLATVLLPGCGRVTSHFSGHTTTRKGTIAASPPTGPPGTTFTLRASGFEPGESMTFEVEPPKGTLFVGPPHTAGPDGVVTASYSSQSTDRPGPYTLKAVGAKGTRARANLTLEAPPPSSTGR